MATTDSFAMVCCRTLKFHHLVSHKIDRPRDIRDVKEMPKVLGSIHSSHMANSLVQQTPLSGLKVLEIAGLAPVPFAGLILADFGADVVRVDRTKGFNPDVLTRHKRSIALDFKNPQGITTFIHMIRQADVLIEPFRPGVMEKLGLGPEVLCNVNPRLVYARLSGYGQTGKHAHVAGHDINYVAMSGLMSMLGRQGENPLSSLNIVADFAGGGLMCVMGILLALTERQRSGKGQVVDVGMTLGAAYLATFPYLMRKTGLQFTEQRGTNLLDGGAPFYDVYRTRDGKFVSVGAIEPQFYAALLKGLSLEPSTLPPQTDSTSWPAIKQLFAQIFGSRTRDEWTHVFESTEACVTPVLEFGFGDQTEPVASEPRPAPILSRTPARGDEVKAGDDADEDGLFLERGKDSVVVLREFGFKEEEVRRLVECGAVGVPQKERTKASL